MPYIVRLEKAVADCMCTLIIFSHLGAEKVFGTHCNRLIDYDQETFSVNVGKGCQEVKICMVNIKIER